MSTAPILIVLVPVAAGLGTWFVPGRWQARLGVAAAFGTCAAVGVAILEATRQGTLVHALGGWPAPLGIVLQVDGLSVLLLGLSAIVGLGVSLSAPAYFSTDASGARGAEPFWPLWLLLWGGLNALFVTTDVFNLYLLLEFTLLAAVALAARGGSVAGHVSALRYLLAATAAALFYLAGVALIYAETGTLHLQGIRDGAAGGVLTVLALGLMTGGLALKAALFPLHFWLPAAHSTAPAPVSAVLSAIVVKAGFYGIVRVWLQALPEALPAVFATVLATLGGAAILWGSWQALRQERLKMLIAYSTVAQVGYLFLLLPLAAVARAEVIAATTYQVVSHGLAKSALFLGAGAVLGAAHSDLLARTHGLARHAPLAVAAILIGGAALAGVAPGGGAKGTMAALAGRHGHWWSQAVIVGGMALAAAYTYAAVRPMFRGGAPDVRPHTRHRALEMTALALALAALALSFFSDAVLRLLEIGRT